MSILLPKRKFYDAAFGFRFLLSAAILCGTWSTVTCVHATIIGPYTADANTLHLYHFDENQGVGTTTADVGNAGTLYALTTTGGVGGGTTGGAAFSGFGTSLNTTGSSSTAGAEHATDNVVNATTFWNSNALDAIPDGAFTWEAIVKFNDLAAPTQSLIALENEGSTGRYGRLLYKGGATASSRFLEFNKVGTDGGGGQTIDSIQLPSAGTNAVNTTDWFHLAVTYDGNANTADNLKFYFTKMTNDSFDVAAILLSSHSLNNDLAGGGGATGTGDFAVGNNARSLGSKFNGLVDEVRISDMARGSNDFIFVPEPSSYVLTVFSCIGALTAVRRRGR
jgi:hypothetical protein